MHLQAIWGPLTGVLSAVVDDEWRPGLGDPTVLGWATTLAYFAACVLCARAFVQTRRAAAGVRSSDLRPTFWLVLAGLLLLLGINKQLDLQTWFTITAKKMALAQGWYGRRRYYQRLFIFAVFLAGYGGLLGGYFLVRGAARRHLIAIAGMAFLLSFVFIRAASFHHFDMFIRAGIGPIRMNHVLENAGIVCLAVAAWRAQVAAQRFPGSQAWRDTRR